jgi:hypothetical protein
MSRRLTLLLAPLVLGLLPAAPAGADRAHDLAAQAGSVQRRTCQDVTTLSACHPAYPTGCSSSANPQYDAYLNFLKNQVPSPGSQTSRYITRTTIRSLDAATPGGITSRNHAQHAPMLANLGEGNIVALIGYLNFVQDTGAETTNCLLAGNGETDFHIGIGFNRTVARGLQDGHTPDAVERRRLQQTSIVVEVTPHYRAQHRPEWTEAFLRRFIGRQVKVIGQLMLDNEHAVPDDNCADPSADTDQCWRMTAWEVHPVIRFYVCTTTTSCPRASSAWKLVEEVE